MKIYNGFSDKGLKSRKRSVAIGIFDGVHLGHQKILKRILSWSKSSGASPCVVTFDPHPARVLFPEKRHPAVLMSLPHRLKFFESMGIKETVVVRFDKKFSKVSREFFMENFLLRRMGMTSLCVGHDFRFGYKALGDEDFLRHAAKEKGFELSIMDPVEADGNIISSTRIRALIEAGELKKAERMLGRPVSVSGTVLHGRGRGKSVGFPTANLNPHHEALPPAGVYAAFGYLRSKKLKGVIHIGKRPTFGDEEKSLEVHFLDFKGDLYGEEIELIFHKKLREIRRFDNASSLALAIQKDIKNALKALASARR